MDGSKILIGKTWHHFKFSNNFRPDNQLLLETLWLMGAFQPSTGFRPDRPKNLAENW